jgi:hypothetical protein
MQPSELKAYWDEVAAAAGISSDAVEKIGALFENEGTSKQFLDKFVPKSEYSRAVNDGKDAAEKSQARLTEATAKIQEFDKWAKETALPYAERLEKQEKLVAAQVKAYEGLYGPLDARYAPNPSAREVAPDPNSNSNGAPAVTPENLSQILGTSQSNMLSLVTDFTDLAFKHQHRFGEPLDIPNFKSFAETKFGEAQQQGRSITLNDAYSDFTREESTALDAKERKDEISKAVEKAKEALEQRYSQTHIPIEGAPADDDMRINIDPDNAIKAEDKLNESDRMRGFVEEWNKTIEEEEAQTA